MAEDNLKKLQKAKVLDTRNLSEREKKKINSLTDREIQQLIQLRKRVGPYDARQHGLGSSPWIL